MSGKLATKVALVTGSSSGIGRAAALGAKSVAIQADFANGKDAVDSLWEQFEAAAIAATGEPSLDSHVHSPRRSGVLDA
ncbi:MAG: hypothetical protein AAAC50_09125 [Rhizobium altiplani]|jgi:NAD(P)-dependent dehydrogenase (short-subunit alcohol dehydrogenase family)|uniref:hypothetical protein n=1 Tax=Rhizobium altiplani TaxID=1864509 RepID=UPI000DD8D68B